MVSKHVAWPTRWLVAGVVALALVTGAGCGGGDGDKSAATTTAMPAAQATTALAPAAAAALSPTPAGAGTAFPLVPAPTGRPLSQGDIAALAAQFTQNPFLGGQVPPRQYKPVNEDVSIFLQFDRGNPAEAKSLRYIGIGVRSVFCAEAVADKAFTHFHSGRAVPNYAEGHGGQPGEQGTWLMWVAVEPIAAQGRQVTPGVDYAFSPTPPPSCGSNVPAAAWQMPDAHKMTSGEIMQLAALFNENPLTGGQVAPRLYKWVNENVAIFLEFDKPNPAEAKALRYFGIGIKGEFCKSKQPSPDFAYFQRASALTYAEGRGGAPGAEGFWHVWIATDKFELQGRQVTPGVDRAYSPTPPPDC